MKKITKKLLGMLLALAMVLTMIPAMSITASAAENELTATLTYTVGDDTSEQSVTLTELTEIGTYARTKASGVTYRYNGKVYLAELPYGTCLKKIEWTNPVFADGFSISFLGAGMKSSGVLNSLVSQSESSTIRTIKADIENYYLTNSDFTTYDVTKNKYYSTNFLDCVSDDVKTSLKTEDVKGIVVYGTDLINNTSEQVGDTINYYQDYNTPVIVIQISTKSTAPAITVGSVEEINPGSEITVPVTITNNPGYKGFTAIPSYDKNALELTGVSRGEITADGNIEFTGTEAVTGDSLVDLTFKVKDAAEAGDYEIGLTMDSFYDAEENAIAADITAGKVTVKLTAAQQINALPQDVTLEDKAQIEAARAAYEALTDEEKAAVSEADLAKLEVAEAKLEVAQAKADKAVAEEAQAKAEADKKAAEEAQAQAEADKKAAEEAQAQAEADKKAAEEAQAQAEADKKAAEEAQAQAEADKKAAEEAQAQAEADKKAAEEAQAQAEADKKVAEEAQAQAEADKATAEEALAKAETDKKAAEEALAAEKAKTANTEKVNTQTTNAQNATVSGLKVTSKSKKLTVTYKKNAKVNGYQVCYKLKTAKKFSTLKTTTAVKVTSKKLKKGKVYQVKVRPYTNVNGKKVYGQWTAVKSIKCK